ncbi:peptidyl-tRNA hydrolase [Biomphalaria pfeifferi]|uniref:Peptidyl-tRNA hydrolase n=1 Tax=Biomphalaria pfeifferi TaxID=112525 RepID=A0AAD8C5L8_BIOPF|nr:peptidyl-tRNA hydrolase [Biomphalaria pfeifferi]
MQTMGQVKQSVLSVINSNYFTWTKNVLNVFVTRISSVFYHQTSQSLTFEMQHTTKSNHFLIVGLGNYGFDKTRHSVGMRAVDILAKKLDVKWEHHHGFIGSIKLDDIYLTLFKPKALMNINGRSVAKLAHQLSVKSNCIYLIHDELDRVPGKFHLKEGGSAGGHNGVLSCMETLGSKDMMRLRIGIGRPSSKTLVVPHVLGQFSKEESSLVELSINQGLQCLLDHIKTRSASVTHQIESGSPTAAPDPTVAKRDGAKNSSPSEDTLQAKDPAPSTNDCLHSEHDKSSYWVVDRQKNIEVGESKCANSEITPER